MRTFFHGKTLPAPFSPAGNHSTVPSSSSSSNTAPEALPINSPAKTKKMKIMFWQQDGSASPEAGLELAKTEECDGVIFVDTRCKTDDRGWLYLAKTYLGTNVFARSFKGLQQLLGGSIGGTAVAFANGWQRRCRCTTNDCRDWGRISTTKISGCMSPFPQTAMVRVFTTCRKLT
jgi:hypothetical protein